MKIAIRHGKLMAIAATLSELSLGAGNMVSESYLISMLYLVCALKSVFDFLLRL